MSTHQTTDARSRQTEYRKKVLDSAHQLLHAAQRAQRAQQLAREARQAERAALADLLTAQQEAAATWAELSAFEQAWQSLFLTTTSLRAPSTTAADPKFLLAQAQRAIEQITSSMATETGDANTAGRRIPVGTDVTWTLSGARGSLTYSGRILAFVEEGANLGDFKSTYHGGSLLNLKWASSKTPKIASVDRYVVETVEGCRTITAGVLEMQLAKAEASKRAQSRLPPAAAGTSKQRLPAGSDVTWTVSNARSGTQIYSGRIHAFVPAKHDIYYWLENVHHYNRIILNSLKWVTQPIRDACMDRYIVETPAGLRTVAAKTLEMQVAKAQSTAKRS